MADNLEQLRNNDEDGWRWYTKGTSKYPSVTTILENTIANPKLANWFKNNTAKKIDQVSTNSAKVGTECHELFEKILLDQIESVPDQYYHHAKAFWDFKVKHGIKAQHTEHSLFSDKYGFAGTVDFIGEYEGELYILDWKVTKRFKITNGWQLGAYRLAYSELGGDTPKLGGLQIHSQTAEPKFFKYEHFDFVERQFLFTLENFKGLYFNKLSKLDWPWLKKVSIFDYIEEKCKIQLAFPT